jgi:hypothetical protein
LVVLTTGSALAQTPQYAIEGLALGAKVEVGSPAFRGYQCSRSEQFAEFTRCQRNQQESRRSGSSSSFLYGGDGKAQYINYYVSLWLFDRNGIQSEISKLSKKFGERPREMRLPQREGLPNAVIASWGKIQLQLLEPDAMAILAAGESPRKGLLIDYLGDLRRSAQLGLPVFSITGGAGYLLSASVDRNSRGHMRFLTADPSALSPVTTRSSLPAETEGADKVATEADKVAAEEASVVAEAATGEPEKMAQGELVSAEPRDITPPSAAHIDALIVRLEAGLVAAQARSQAMESLAYRAIAALIIVLLAVPAFLIWRSRAATSKRRALATQTATAAQTAATPSELSAQKGSAVVGDATARQQPILAAATSEAKSQARCDQPQAQGAGKEEVAACFLSNEAVRASASKPCARCSCEISIEDKFCVHCGAPAGAEESALKTQICPSCSGEMGTLDRFCRHCGASSLVTVVAPSLLLASEPA